MFCFPSNSTTWIILASMSITLHRLLCCRGKLAYNRIRLSLGNGHTIICHWDAILVNFIYAMAGQQLILRTRFIMHVLFRKNNLSMVFKHVLCLVSWYIKSVYHYFAIKHCVPICLYNYNNNKHCLWRLSWEYERIATCMLVICILNIKKVVKTRDDYYYKDVNYKTCLFEINTKPN